MRIGIDLGGTKIEGIALSQTGEELARLRVPTPRSYDATLGAIEHVVRSLEATTQERGSVGVGIPGAVSLATGRVKNANSVWLIGEPLLRDLHDRLARPVRVMNDADCFALSEATDGAAAGAETVFGVILGTGVGGGIVVNGRCLQGPNLIAGEWGHNPLPWPQYDEFDHSDACYCGKSGCIETWLSGPAFERDFAELSGTVASARDIVSWAQTDEVPPWNPVATRAAAQDALMRYHDRLARALASVINVLDPHVIVLGGGMSNTPLLAESVGELLPRWVFSDTVETRLVRHRHGDSSGVRGAAWLWPAGEGAP